MKLLSPSSLLLWLALGGIFSAHAELTARQQLLPGIVTYSEVRTNPPQRLFIAEIDLTQPRLQLRVAPGGPDPDGPGPWETTLMRPTAIATRENFHLVINGDFYEVPRAAESGTTTQNMSGWAAVNGHAVSSGKAWSTSRAARPCLVVDRTGKVSIQMVSQPEADHFEVVAGNTLLLRNGARVNSDNKVRHPRTVVGLNHDATKLILLVVDGRKAGVALGMSYDELATEMLRLGAHDALNLDGGGSSVLAVRPEQQKTWRILNAPTDGRERPVANVLGVTVGP